MLYSAIEQKNRKKAKVPAGVRVGSFTAEAFATESALTRMREYIKERWRGRMKFMTDSRSLLDGLQSAHRHQAQKVQSVSKPLREITSIALATFSGF